MNIRKWYLDCVDEGGTAWIGYWARIGCGPLKFHAASSMLDGATIARSGRFPEPRLHGRTVTWDGPDVHVEMSVRSSGARKELFPGVIWECVAPCAEVTVRAGDSTLHGRGYADLVEMTVAPWQLPLRELRWGRAIGEHTSQVWIQWSGEHPVDLVLRDGVLQPPEHLHFAISDSLRLRDNLLGEALAPLPLVWLLPRRFTRAREQKWRSRATLQSPDGSLEHGWVIHELVTFPAR